MRIRSLFRSLGSAFLLVALCNGQSHANVANLANRVPPGANSIAYINVESLVNSKLGRQEKWRDKLANASATRPVVLPPDAKQAFMASWIDTASLDPVWEVALIETSKSISVDRLAKDASGFTEAFGSKRAAWTPMNAYFVRLDQRLLGVVSPAYRQFAARWSADTSSAAGTLSPYLAAAVEKIGPATGYLFALDLQDAVSEKRVRRRLDFDEFDSLADQKFDARELGETIASAKGLTLTIEVRSQITGKAVIEFGRPTQPLASFSKSLLLEILDNAGAAIDDFSNWKFSTQANSIVVSGKLTTEGLSQLCSIIDPPNPTQTDEAPANEPGTVDAPDPAAVAAASRHYYQAVSTILNGFGKRIRSAESLSKGAAYVARDARNVGRLPIMNVDPELLKWGASVSARLLEVASTLGVGGSQARARAESILNPYVSGGVDYNAELRRNPNDAIERQNAARQRRAAVAEEKSRALQQATQIFLELEASRSEVRSAMTIKYKIEF